jgi:hypothetical protein
MMFKDRSSYTSSGWWRPYIGKGQMVLEWGVCVGVRKYGGKELGFPETCKWIETKMRSQSRKGG